MFVLISKNSNTNNKIRMQTLNIKSKMELKPGTLNISVHCVNLTVKEAHDIDEYSQAN